MSRKPWIWAGAAAAVTGGVLGGATLAARTVLARQAAHARRLIGKPLGEQALDSDRVWKKKYGDRVELLVLGDSIAAGLGAELPRQVPGARLGRKLARETRRAVRVTTAANVGSESSALADQLESLPTTYRPDVAVIVVGGNDVTHRVPVAESTAHLAEAVDRLVALDASVVVGTCPDLGALRPLPQPLRALGSRASRHLAEAQRRTAVAHGAHAVSLAAVVGPFFLSNPDEMFSLDRFHPSAAGYKRMANALLPSVLAALGERDVDLPFGHHAPLTSEH